MGCIRNIPGDFHNVTVWSWRLVYFWYNIAPKKEKAKYDEKKLCRTTGFGMAVIAFLILVMGLFEDVLPAGFAYISLGVVVVDCLVIILVSHTFCKK